MVILVDSSILSDSLLFLFIAYFSFYFAADDQNSNLELLEPMHVLTSEHLPESLGNPPNPYFVLS